MKILIIGDPLENLNFKADGSLYLARAFQEQGDQVFWARTTDIWWQGLSIRLKAKLLNKFSRGEKPEGESAEFELSNFKRILIRTDPPFDENYLRLCWLLAPFEKKLHFINKPSLLCRYHEKMLPYEAFHQGFISKNDLAPMGVLQTREALDSYLKSDQATEFVRKPWLGYAGHRVELLTREQVTANGLDRKENLIFQSYLPQIKLEGDRRVLFCKGKFVGEFVRFPQEGQIISNIAQGGRAGKGKMTPKHWLLVKKIEKFLRKIGVDIAGADLIGTKLNEINITSPTGFAPFEDLYGKNLAPIFAKALRK